MNNLKGLSERTKAEIMAMSIVEVYQAGYEAGKSSTSSSVEVVQETVEHEGLVLRKVNRKVSSGDYVKFHNTRYGSRFKDGVIYGPVKRTMTIGENDYNVFNDYHNRTLYNVEVFEVVGNAETIELVAAPLTANQQRAELIQRAKRKVSYRMQLVLENRGKFVVDSEKRTVVLLTRKLFQEKYTFASKAKCHPNDVFNADIGKLIAIMKFSKDPIPQEFLQAVQPTKVVNGMVLQTLGGPFPITSDNPIQLLKCERILDDSNAKYSEVAE